MSLLVGMHWTEEWREGRAAIVIGLPGLVFYGAACEAKRSPAEDRSAMHLFRKFIPCTKKAASCRVGFCPVRLAKITQDISLIFPG